MRGPLASHHLPVTIVLRAPPTCGAGRLTIRAGGLDETARGLIEEFRKQAGVVALVGISDGKAAVTVAVTADLTGRFSAADLAKVHGAEVIGVYTNTTPTDAYRGAGQPEANLTIERVLDAAARQLGVDPLDLRWRNVITRFPHPLISGDVVDCGDFQGLLRMTARQADASGFAARKASSAAKGLLRGLGIAPYLEVILGKSAETARLVLDDDGGATLYVGTQSNGQGHETVYARMLAEQSGIDEDLIRIVQGDSDRIAVGGGTGGSRSLTAQGTASRAALTTLAAGLAAFLGGEFGLDGVTFDQQVFAAPGSNLRLTMAEAARLARAGGHLDLLDRSADIVVDPASYPNGCHAAEVEIDPETGAMRLDRYVVVDDFGVQIAPQIVAGQVHGGIAQGYGQAVTEVAIDTLTGENRVLAVDILHDVGRSINPAIDIGQIEGGFVQGMGWLTTEQLVWNGQGLLQTHAPSTYKIPTTGDLPAHWRVDLWPEPNREDNVHGSKAVGEPPFMLAISVFEALRDAVARSGGDPQAMNAPATAEEVLRGLGG